MSFWTGAKQKNISARDGTKWKPSQGSVGIEITDDNDDDDKFSGRLILIIARLAVTFRVTLPIQKFDSVDHDANSFNGV